MGECGCSNELGERAYRLPSGNVVVVGDYHGCRECYDGPGYSVEIFDTPEHANEWYPGLRQEPFRPDEYGGNEGVAMGGGLFESHHLAAAAEEIEKEGATVGEKYDQYETVSEWLRDCGLELIQRAMRLRAAEAAEEKP